MKTVLNRYVRFFVIPDNLKYVEHGRTIPTKGWEELDNIDPNRPICILIVDSIPTHYARFIVTYKHMMQEQGGGGSCYNPGYKGYDFVTKKHFNWFTEEMSGSMSKIKPYREDAIWELVCYSKKYIIEKLCRGASLEDKTPMFLTSVKQYVDRNYAMLAVMLERYAQSIINQTTPNFEFEHVYSKLSRKLLPAHI